MVKPNLWTEDYRITSYLVNLKKRAGLYAVLNLVQDVGWQHAIQLGLNFSEQGLLWVFTRQKLVMTEWPAWNETLTLNTWLRPAGATPFVQRDYELLVKGRKIGECTSSFTVIDAATRKLANPDWRPFAEFWREGHDLSLAPAKIPLQEGGEMLASFEVRNGDLDLNDHVNNTRYAQWILDAVPVSDLRTAELHEYEANFLAETRLGDVMSIHRHTPPGTENCVQFQGVRQGDGKTVFSARMKVTLG